jgi:hypothetical protein
MQMEFGQCFSVDSRTMYGPAGRPLAVESVVSRVAKRWSIHHSWLSQTAESRASQVRSKSGNMSTFRKHRAYILVQICLAGVVAHFPLAPYSRPPH